MKSNFDMLKNILFLILLLLISCSLEENSTNKNITQAIPKSSDLIIKFHDINQINQKIKDYKWWKELQSTTVIAKNLHILDILNQRLNIYEIFQNKTIYVSSMLVGDNKHDFLITTSISDVQTKSNQLMRMVNSSVNNQKFYEGVQINNIKFNTENFGDQDIFFAIQNNIFILSFSEMIIQESIRQINTKTDLFKIEPIHKLDKNLPKYSDLNILVKTNFLEKKIGQQNIFINSNTWSWFDVELENNNILLNGVTNRGNIKYLIDNQYSDSKKSNIENILPRHIKGFYRYQINSTLDLNEVVNTIIDGAHENIYHLSYSTWYPTEINVGYHDSDFLEKSYVIFKPNKKNICIEHLNKEGILELENYFDYEITRINLKKMGSNDWLNKITSNWKDGYYTLIDGYIALSSEKKKIKSLINNIASNQTIGNSNALNIINNKLGSKSHTSFYLNFQEHDEEWKQTFNSIVSKHIASEDYFFNSIILLSEDNTVANPTEWISSLDSETNFRPQFVLNHYTKRFEIVTQDIENKIYLINPDGSILWRKEIGSSILGQIHQIDRFNNKKLQYLFNTTDSIYLIDRNGNHVSPFPIKTSEKISQPIAVFDYDKNHKYRLLVVMDNKLTMYNAEGKQISGWQFLNTNSNITTTPEHYQIFNKDYIVISEQNGATHLLNRKGESRTQMYDKLNRSDQKMNLIKGKSLYESKFITMNDQGQIISLNLNGTIDTMEVQSLSKNDQYIKTEDYTLLIKGKKLIFSSINNRFEYNFNSLPDHNPQVLFIDDSVVIFVRNKNENLIYMLNEKGDLYTNPFFGTTEFSIIQQENIKMIVGSHEGIIYNYKIN